MRDRNFDPGQKTIFSIFVNLTEIQNGVILEKIDIQKNDLSLIINEF